MQLLSARWSFSNSPKFSFAFELLEANQGEDKLVAEDKALESIATILDSLDQLVYVSDMDTYEILLINRYGQSQWGDAHGKICWKVLQKNQSGPCEFCTNDKLLDGSGKPTGVYVWEFQNTSNKRWYQCRDQAIRWIDGRLVRMEIATDITDRKEMENRLREAVTHAKVLAREDELTGLNNRRTFFECGAYIFKQMCRSHSYASVIMMDLDDFKSINDLHGHAKGDEILVAVASVIKTHVREIDIVGRLGGEEFAFIFPNTGLDESRPICERLRIEISKIVIESKGERRHVTSSFGLAISKGGTETLEKVLGRADDALYRAKKYGRNRVEMAHTDNET